MAELVIKTQYWESKVLTQVFPEEIWRLILHHHSSSVEVRNVAHASKYFEDLLYPDRTLLLFPFIWQLIAARLVIRNKNQFCQWLNMRLVCKKWSTVIDRSFESVDAHNILKRGMAWPAAEDYTHSKFRLFVSSNNSLKETHNLFLNHFNNTHHFAGGRNPLVSKSVIIFNEARNPLIPFHRLPDSLNFLSTYGKFVKHCSLITSDFVQLCQFLKRMTNLKSLAIYYSKNTFDELESDHKEIADWLKICLPTLPNLTFLNLERGPENITKILMGKCINLSSFSYINKSIDISGLVAQPLKQLRVCVDSKAYTILKARTYLWPLTDVELKFEKNCFVEWPELFTLLHDNWNKTLKRLKIALPEAAQPCYIKQIVNWSFRPLLKLHNLTHFTLTMNNLHCLDFILPLCASLEYLSIELGYSLEEMQILHNDEFRYMKNKQVVKLLGHVVGSRLIDSNIGTLFPILKELHYRSENKDYKFIRLSDENPWDFSEYESDG